jgi:hypothetical protein
MLSSGLTRVYELINTGELESYLDGRSRKITVASIKRYIARRLEAEAAGDTPRSRPGRADPATQT